MHGDCKWNSNLMNSKNIEEEINTNGNQAIL